MDCLSDNHVTIRFTTGAVAWIPVARGSAADDGRSLERVCSAVGTLGTMRGSNLFVGSRGDGVAIDVCNVDARDELRRVSAIAVSGESLSKIRAHDGDVAESFDRIVSADKVEDDVRVVDVASDLYQETGDSRVNFTASAEQWGSNGGGGIGDSSVSRGKWFERNRRKREMRKARRVAADAALKFPAQVESGYFSACDESVKADLRSSRAKMLIAQNEQRARKALADVDRMNMEKDTRVNEAKFELNRLTVDDKLRKISEARMGGSAQTVISSSITSSPPSLSSGSVSPNSSISVAEEMRLRNAVSSLTLEVEQLKKKQVNEVHDGTFVRREVRGTGVYRVHTEEDEFGYSQWD